MYNVFIGLWPVDKAPCGKPFGCRQPDILSVAGLYFYIQYVQKVQIKGGYEYVRGKR